RTAAGDRHRLWPESPQHSRRSCVTTPRVGHADLPTVGRPGSSRWRTGWRSGCSTGGRQLLATLPTEQLVRQLGYVDHFLLNDLVDPDTGPIRFLHSSPS